MRLCSMLNCLKLYIMKSIRLYEYALTIWSTDNNPNSVYDELVSIKTILSNFPHLSKYLIGGPEFTEEKLIHYHCYLKFKNARTFESVLSGFDCLYNLLSIKNIKQFPHIEYVRDKYDYISYCIAPESKVYDTLLCYYSNFDYDKIEQSSTAECILFDIRSGMSLENLIDKYPKFAVYHLNNLIKLYNFYNGGSDD